MSVANPDRTILETFPLESSPEEFTDDDLRLIKHMCILASPQAMSPAAERVYGKAKKMLDAR